MAGTLIAEAYAELREGRRRMNYPATSADLLAAAQHFRNAIALDAGMTFDDARAQEDVNARGYPKAWGHLGYATLAAWIEGAHELSERAQVMAEAQEYTSNAVEQARGDLDYDTHWDRAFYFQMSGPDDPLNYDRAICEYLKAIDLNIVDSNLLLEASEAYVSAGRPDDAIEMIRRAGRSIRHDWYRWDLAWAYFFKARLGGDVFYNLAIDEIRKMYWSPGEPKYMIDVQLLAAACYARLGKTEMSQTSFGLFSQASNGKPSWTINDEDRARPFKLEEDRLHWLEACKLAGLTDPGKILP